MKFSCILLIVAIILPAGITGCVGLAGLSAMDGALRGYQSATYPLAPKIYQSTTPSLNLSGTLKLIGQDGQFLGYINVSPYDTKSFLNEYGIYGSKYSATSIWNSYSQYGSSYSNLSAFSPYATQPPMIYSGQTFIAYLTMNKYLYPAITPLQLLQVLTGNH